MDVFARVRDLIAENNVAEARRLAFGVEVAGTAEQKVAALISRIDVLRAEHAFLDGRALCAEMLALLPPEASKNPDLLTAMALRARHYRFYAESLSLSSRVVTLVGGMTIDATRLASALNNMGLAAEDLRQWPEAERLFNSAIAAEDRPEFHVNLAHVLLRRGQWTEGWAQYTHRPWRDQALQVCDPWDGSIDGDLVVVDEQGAGDSFQFLRYLPVLRDRFQGSITLWTSPEIAQLADMLGWLDGIDSTDTLAANGSRPKAMRLMDVPMHLGLGPLDSIPPELDEDRHEGPLRVGLVWRGNPDHANDHNRSMTDDHAQAIIDANPDVMFFRLQLDGDLEGLMVPDEPPTSWLETTGLLLQMDAVVSVDTAIAHLAATLGKPTMILLPFCPDWRWGLTDEDCPWYMTAETVRQTLPGDWSGPIRATKEFLESQAAMID